MKNQKGSQPEKKKASKKVRLYRAVIFIALFAMLATTLLTGIQMMSS